MKYFFSMCFLGIMAVAAGCSYQSGVSVARCVQCKTPNTITAFSLDPMLTNYGVHYVYLRGKLAILVPTLVLFDPVEDELKSQGYPVLDVLAKYLQQYPNANILVAGNASPIVDTKLFESGTISLRRARTVAGYLKSRGIQAGCRSLLYTSYGAKYPIATNERNSGLTANRRIQILVYPQNTLPYAGCKKPPKAVFYNW